MTRLARRRLMARLGWAIARAFAYVGAPACGLSPEDLDLAVAASRATALAAPPPACPERLRPDVPPGPAERLLWAQLRQSGPRREEGRHISS
jgi:hypothetical protein